MMRSCRDNTVALGILLGLGCASVPFAALAQNFFPGLFNPFGAQRPAPTFAAPVHKRAPFGAQPRAPTSAAPFWQGTQPQAPNPAAPFWQGTQPQAPTSAAPFWQGALPNSSISAAPGEQD